MRRVIRPRMKNFSSSDLFYIYLIFCQGKWFFKLLFLIRIFPSTSLWYILAFAGISTAIKTGCLNEYYIYQCTKIATATNLIKIKIRKRKIYKIIAYILLIFCILYVYWNWVCMYLLKVMNLKTTSVKKYFLRS